MPKKAKKQEVASISASINYSSENMQGLRQARTATEFRNILDRVVSVASGFAIPRELESLSAKAVDLADIEGAVTRKQAKAINLNQVIDVSKIDINDVQQKAQYNNQVAELNQALSELGVAYQILASRTFSAFKDQKSAADSLLRVIKDARDTQSRMVKLMSLNNKEGTPVEHRKLVATMANYLSKILNKEQYSRLRQRTFIAHGSDPIVFQTYIYIDDFVNSEGEHYQNYALVLSTKIAVATGISENYVTTLVDEKVPGSFPMGTLVETAPTLKKTINNLMAVDGFLNYSERKPLNKTTGFLKRNTQFGSEVHNVKGRDAEIFDDVRIQNDSLYVRLVRGLTPTEKRDAVQEIVAMASALFRGGKAGRNSIIHRTAKGRTGREYVIISVTTSQGTEKGILTVAKIDQIAQVMGLNPQQKRLLKQSVK